MDDQLLNAIKSVPAQEPPKDALDAAQSLARRMRDLSLELKDLTEKLEARQKLLTQISTKDLPELLSEHRLRGLSLEAEGNMPAYDLVLQPYYKAVLPKEEDEGLRWLEDNGHGDMIRRIYTVALGKDAQEDAEQLRAFLEEHDLAFEEKESVPWTTLTAFVKEQIEKHHETPPLEILGAIVGKIVKMKPKAT